MNERNQGQSSISAALGFLRRHRTGFLEGLVAAIIMIVLASGIYTVNMEERAMVTRFGKVIKPEVGPGVRYRFPVMDQAYVHPSNTIVHYQVSSHKGGRITFTVLSAGSRLIEVDVALRYRIDDPKSYLFASNDPRTVMTALVSEELATMIGDNPIEPILNFNRDVIQRQLLDAVTRYLESEAIGVEIVTLEIVNVRAIEPALYALRGANGAITDRARSVG